MNILLKSLLLAATVLFSFSASSLAQDQKKIDDDLLKKHFAKNKIKATKTATGLYYVISKKGTGPNAKAGQNVSMKYQGKFLDGKQFDGNMDDNFNLQRPTPLQFQLGKGMVIAGWDEGIQLLNKGCRATFYIPSGLGYGPGGRGPIPANTCMVFNVELVDAQ